MQPFAKKAPDSLVRVAPIHGWRRKQRKSWDKGLNLVLELLENSRLEVEVVESGSEELQGRRDLPLARSAAGVAGFSGLFGHL